MQGSQEIGEDGRIKLEVNDGEVVLICKAAQKEDQGRYSVNLKNAKGFDTVHLNVTVLDKPGSPEGPLEVSKITPESCKLQWKPPKVGRITLQSNLYFLKVICFGLMLLIRLIHIQSNDQFKTDQTLNDYR